MLRPPPYRWIEYTQMELVGQEESPIIDYIFKLSILTWNHNSS
jgi:hypothetical protein